MDFLYETVRAKQTYLLPWMSRRARTPALVLLATLALSSITLAQEVAKGSAVEFVRDVVPILRDKCVSCHGPKVQQSGLRLDLRFEMLRGGKSGPAILENDDTKSLLIRRVSGSDA